MIVYNSSSWRTIMRVKGSVFPEAAKLAAFSALLAWVLKYLDRHEEIDLQISESQMMTQSAGFSLFYSTLAFVLVFRTSQCYSRFWHCATSVSTMRAQMAEAASSLVSFSVMSKKPAAEIQVFRHKIVRMFSLLHAMCLATFCDRDMDFPIIEVASFDPQHLNALKNAKKGKERVDIIYMWINSYIIKMVDSGLLNVPAPILSRVFQEMEKAMVEFHQVMQVMTIPFPFPYAQMAIVLLFVMVVGTPVAMCYWTNNEWAAAFLTFIAIVCLTCLELIADQLDNPFGDDDNDLPCHDFQNDINDTLKLLLTPECENSPDMRPFSMAYLEGTLQRANSAVSFADGFVSFGETEPDANYDGHTDEVVTAAALPGEQAMAPMSKLGSENGCGSPGRRV